MRLDALGSYEEEIGRLVAEYDTIIGGLDLAALDDAKKASLVGTPEKLISAGGAVEFAESCRTLIGNYATLIDTLRRLHLAVRSQFVHAQHAIGESRSLYSKIDEDHAFAFEGLLGDSSPKKEG
ncbi:hypothetical protein [Actinophytocola gossypii]|uniref:Flagellar protein FlgN n=1 Tax=Actinophytocola gossypii TaxID=2812003 RepID=A0ABT2JGI9_9PSEU|nr:hypothetical protein [Actinophytocola gossypii]MCT2586891.1 hypothetical protein [Actinophytocola gossypii]